MIRIEIARKDVDYRAVLAWSVKGEYEALAERCATFLHANEASYFRSLKYNRRKMSYLLGRYAAKQALMEYSDRTDATQTEIAGGVFEQPLIHPGFAEATGIGISHTDHVACALAFPEGHPMGIDVEESSPERDAVMGTQILPSELDLADRSWAAPASRLALLWTAKEALSKTLRCGMTCPFEIFAVKDLQTDGSSFGGCFENFAQYRFQSWVSGRTVLTIVLPRHSAIRTSLEPFLRSLG